jgi:BRCT domain type II-containing protein
VKSLTGLNVAFTGFLSRPRSTAITAAKKAGAKVQSKPGLTTDVLVRGRPNVLQVAGDAGGTKLMEIRRLAGMGHAVHVIGDKQFWKLVDGSDANGTKIARQSHRRAGKRGTKRSDTRARQVVH